MEYRKWKDNNIIVCLTKKEIGIFLKQAKWELIEKIMVEKRWSLADVMADQKKVLEVVQPVSESLAEDKDEVEIFVAFDSIVDFYKSDSLICFPLRANFNTSRDTINSFSELKNSIEEASPDDIIIFDGVNYRSFQMKRYRGKLETQDIGKYIVNKIEGYGNLGDRNLLVIPQSDLPFNIDFHELHDFLKNEKPPITGQVLVGFNANNKEFLLNQVYPDLNTSSIPIRESAQKLSKVWRKMKNNNDQ
ncbi:MAG: hypothetical protein U0522_00265 [Candidatus Paceibacterota bacterium]